MIIYQIRSHQHKNININTCECTSCHQKGNLEMQIWQKYIWFLGPIRPSYKYGMLRCKACNSLIHKKNWNKELDTIYQTEKNSVKTPAKMWRGLWVMPIILILFIITIKILEKNFNYNAKKAETEFATSLQNIKNNDLLYVQMVHVPNAMKPFRVVQIEKINGDTLFIKTSSTEYADFDSYKTMDKSNIDFSKMSTETQAIVLSDLKRNKVLNLFDNKNNNTVYAVLTGFMNP